MDCTSKCRNFNHAADVVLSAITRENLTSFQTICQRICVNFPFVVDAYGRSPLHVAASCGKHDIVEWLVKEKRVDIGIRDKESNWTPLHRSLFYGQLHCSVKLLQFGADPNSCDNEDLTPLDLVMLDCPYKLARAGLSSSKYNRFEADVQYHLDERLEVYTWGGNSNFTLGHGDENTRHNPELLETISVGKDSSITEVVMCKFHSVFLTDEGQVFTCGHGRGGRLGHGNEETLLVPRRVEGLPGDARCVAVASAQDHTALLTENGDVFTFGLNDNHQLGHSPPPVKSLTPKQVMMKSWKGKAFIGIAAGRYHTVMFTRQEVYTCGLNAGQLGHQKGDRTQITPRQVSSLHLKDIVIHTVCCSDAATVCATNKGDIYLLSQYTCRKIIMRFSGLRSLKVTGGELQLGKHSNSSKHAADETQVTLLNTKGQVFQWRQGSVNAKRCKWLLRRSLNVTSIAVGKQMMITTDQGEAFFCSPRCSHEEGTETKSLHTQSFSSLLTMIQEADKMETVPYKVQRIPMVHRAAKVITDPKSRSFAVLQVDSREGLKNMPIVSKSMVPRHLKSLFNEADIQDAIHDVEIKVKEHIIPSHSFILASRSPTFHNLLLGNKENVPDSCHKDLRRIKLNDSNDYKHVIKWLENLYSCKAVHDSDIFPRSELSKSKRKIETMKSDSVKDSWGTNGEQNEQEDSDIALVNQLGNGGFPCADLLDVSVQVVRNGELSQDDLKLLKSGKTLPDSNKVSRRRSRKADKEKTNESYYLKEDKKEEEQYTLTRTDYPELHDVVVEADDGTQFRCHKCVLVARLDYFRSMFCCDWLESSSEARTFNMPIPASVLEIVLNFLYNGKTPAIEGLWKKSQIHTWMIENLGQGYLLMTRQWHKPVSLDSVSQGCVDVEFLGNVLVVADQLLIGRLKEICEAEMAHLVSFRNVVELLEFSCVYNAEQLKCACMEYICKNLNCFLETRALDHLSEETLLELSKEYKNMIPAMAWRVICPDDLHLPFAKLDVEQVSSSREKRKHSGGRRKSWSSSSNNTASSSCTFLNSIQHGQQRLQYSVVELEVATDTHVSDHLLIRSSKSESDIECGTRDPPQETHTGESPNSAHATQATVIPQTGVECTDEVTPEDDEFEVVTLMEDRELQKATDLISSEGSELDSSRTECAEELKPDESGNWYRKKAEPLVGRKTAWSRKATDKSPAMSHTRPRSEPRNIPSKSSQSSDSELLSPSPMKAAWGVSRVSSPPGSTLKDIMEEEQVNPKPHSSTKLPKHKTTSVTSSCTDAPSSSVVSVKWETGAKKSQKQRKKKSSITKTGPDLKQHNDVVGSPTSPQPKTSPWGAVPKQPMSVKSLRDLIEEEKKKENSPRKSTRPLSKPPPSPQGDKPAGARKKLSWGLHHQLPIGKDGNSPDKETLEQTDTPKRAWQTNVSLSPPSPSTFSNILQSQQQEHTNLDRARKKPLHLIQIEDQAIEELLNYYGGRDNPCEFVTVERMSATAATPMWKKERSLSSAST